MTNSEHNDLEKLLKDNLSDKTAFVPDFVWDKIEEEIYPEKKRRGFFWLLLIGLLVGVAGIIYLAAGLSSAGKPHLAQQTATGQHAASAVQEGVSVKHNVSAAHGTKPTYGSATSGKKEVQTISVRASAGWGKSAQQEATYMGAGSKGKPSHHELVESRQGKTASGNSASADPVIPVGSTGPASILPGKQPGGQTSEDTLRTQRVSQQVLADSSAVTDPVDTTRSQLPEQQGNGASDPVKLAFRRFALNLYGGASLYDMAVFKDYFASGQLSNRSFQSSGFEAGAGFSYQFTRKFAMYAQVAYNRKNTQFNYNLAITESDYFDHVLPGELLPISNIIDNGVGNCFLVKDVKAVYQVDSWLLSLGGTYQVLAWKKFTVGADIRFSANLSSSLALDELTVLKTDPYGTERFNSLRTGAGLNLDYCFNDRISVGISPMFSLQFTAKQSFYAGKVKELLLPLNFRVYF